MEPAPNVAADALTADELARASQRSVFIGHMSVGWNILDGVESVHLAKGVAAPKIVQVDPRSPVSDSVSGAAVLHSEIGVNGDPLGKLENFDRALRSGLADRVDVAMLKFCYVDITGTTDVDALFAAYRSTLAALERDFPDVQFIHATGPLTTGPSGAKENLRVLLRGDDNAAREKYSDLIRATYGQDRVFDIAAIERTAPNGSDAGGLYAGYSSDGAHLNESGSALVAAGLLRMLAQMPATER